MMETSLFRRVLRSWYKKSRYTFFPGIATAPKAFFLREGLEWKARSPCLMHACSRAFENQ